MLTACAPPPVLRLAPALPTAPLAVDFPSPLSGPNSTKAPTGSWQTFNTGDGLPYPSATSLTVDPAGGVWVGTARGAAYFDGTAWTAYAERHGLLSDLVLAVAVDPYGTVWFGGEKGVTRYDGDTWTHFSAEDGLPTGYVQEAAIDQVGKVWFGITGAGSDWAFGNGAAGLDDGHSPGKSDDQWQLYLPTRQRMAGDVVSAIASLGPAGMWFGVTPEGTVRASSGKGGIWRLTGSETPESSDDLWEVRRAEDGLLHAAVSALAVAPDGSLWVGTMGGLMHLTPEAAGEFSFVDAVRYTRSDGLPSERVLSLAADGNQRVWVGTDAGLAVIEAGVINVMTRADGLAADQIRAIAVAPDGAVWVATPSGVSVRR